MSGIEISGKNFLYDAVSTVTFYREVNVPDEEILETLARIKQAYVSRGDEVPDEQWQAVLNVNNLPGAIPKGAGES